VEKLQMSAFLRARLWDRLGTRRRREDDVRAQIASEFYTTLEQLTVDPELLAVVRNWRDTLNDDEILEHLQSFNKTGKVLHNKQ
jgi:hypothetical protein